MIPELLVATDLDFSLLRGTRPIAAGQWEDVTRVVAVREGFTCTVRMSHARGKTFTAHDDAPGWDDFIEHAEEALEGFPRLQEWMAALDAAGGELVLWPK